MTTRRSLDLVFLAGTSAPDGAYDSSGITYDEPGWTYDQQGTDPVSTTYDVTAYPGWGPRSPDWIYRQWDTSPDMEISLLSTDGTPINYSLIASARVSWTLTTYGAYAYQPSAPLVVEADRLRRVWGPSDLLVPGRYRVVVHLVFNSGRTLTVPSTDDAALVVVDGELP